MQMQEMTVQDQTYKKYSQNRKDLVSNYVAKENYHA